MAKTPHTVEVDVKVRNVEFEGLTIRPGDHVLIRVSQHTLDAEMDELLSRLAERLPDVKFTCLAAEQIAVVQDPCPTCSGPIRETVGMVCQTCGTDYGPLAMPAGESGGA